MAPGCCRPKDLAIFIGLVGLLAWLIVGVVVFAACSAPSADGSLTLQPTAWDLVRRKLARGPRPGAELSEGMLKLARSLSSVSQEGTGKDRDRDSLSLLELNQALERAQQLARLILDEAKAAARDDRVDRGHPSRNGEQPSGSGVRGAGGVGTGGSLDGGAKVAQSSKAKVEMYTQQTCYFSSDESELCTFEGPLCFDGTGPVTIVPRPTGQRGYVDDFTQSCIDARYYEPSGVEDSGCSIIVAGARKSYDTSRLMDPSTGYAMGLNYRRWGPQGRNGGLAFRELTPADIAGEADPGGVLLAVSSSGGAPVAGVSIEKGAPYEHAAAPGLRMRMRTVSPAGYTVDWLDGPMWLAGMDGQWATNPFHWWSKVGALYDARRANASTGWGDHPDDGYMQEVVDAARIPGVRSIVRDKKSAQKMPFSTSNSVRYKVGPQWGPLPAIKSIIFAGDGARTLKNTDSVGDWYKSVLELATPPGTTFTFGPLLNSLDEKRLVCSASGGAIPGSKAKWFTGRADAWMWRQYAYIATGLSATGILPHPKYPPRKITLIDRKSSTGRGIHNLQVLLSALSSTGLRVEVVENLGAMTFKEQVALMAGTGILIAPHGAALANSMFLPAHAVVVEMFPYLMKKTTYRHLATMADLHYFPLYSWELLSPDHVEYYGVTLMNEDKFMSQCIARNLSSYDALVEHACNAASKNYPVVVNKGDIENILRDAVDIIGAFSLSNPAWAALAEAAPASPPRKGGAVGYD